MAPHSWHPWLEGAQELGLREAIGAGVRNTLGRVEQSFWRSQSKVLQRAPAPGI